ncbi:unnamed protein product [Diamesa hyperborea]
MATLIPTSQQQQQQPSTTTTAPAAGVESYEDMFKEITRKLYGDESAHGLYPINNAQVAQLATPSAPPEGERSFTTLVSDRSLVQLEYDGVIAAADVVASNNFKSEDHLTTAFGLAALMQNGFPPPTISFPAKQQQQQQQQQQNTTTDERQQQWQQSQQQQTQQQQATSEEVLAWSSQKLSNSYTQKLFKVKTKQEPSSGTDIIITNSVNNPMNSSTINATTSVIKNEVPQIQKRYNCHTCPYSTDRRDLFTRHENIHKEEKPFHCYACLKQFNRADHVKKHFLRMHREMEYDINKTRRYPPSSKQQSNSNNNNNNNNNNNSNKNNNNYFYNQQQQQQSTENQQQPQQQQQQQQLQQQSQQQQQQQQQQPSAITIPSYAQHQTTQQSLQQSSSVAVINSQHHTIEQVVLNGGGSNNNNNNNNHHQTISNIVSIKNEKPMVEKSPKKKVGEKRFMCCYCPWSGADNWGLKRHLNTHTKPFVCLLCDYKAARSERLTTHVFKVHNKKACNKCNFFAEDQTQLNAHQIEAHQNEVRQPRPTTNNHTISNNIATVTTNHSATTNNHGSIIASTSNTGNVLRTLTNTFVPNIHPVAAANHSVFGSLNSSLNNVASSIYTATSSSNNLVEQLNHHLTTNNWRTNNTSTATNNNLSNINTINNSINSNINVSRSTTTTGTSSSLALSTSSSALKRKSGAARLFSYMEADDSDDTESDYARQLQMQALSRNTASVAQDFHNAGGGIKKEINYNLTNINNNSNSSSTTNNHQHHNQHQNENILDASTAVAAATIGNQKKKLKAMSCSPIGRSPPATLNVNHQQHPYIGGFTEVKRRRKIPTTPSSLSSNDKENDNELLSKQLCFLKQQHQAFLGNLNASVMSNTERAKAVKEINEIFEKLYKNSLTLISSMELEQKQQEIKQEYEERVVVKQEPQECWTQDEEMEDVEKCNNKEEPYMDTLPEFLRNNKEITIIVEPKIRSKSNNVVVKQEKLSSDEEQQKEGRKGRKQAKPKKIELEAGEKTISIPNSLAATDTTTPKDSQTLVDNLRDKHMVCLVTRKKCCYICRNRDSDSNSFYTKTSLLLHTKWRHSAMPYDCSNCKTKFQRIYKLKLHKKLFQH